MLRELSAVPFGPEYDPQPASATSVQAVRDDLQPIADDLSNASGTLSDLSASSDDVTDRLDALAIDLDAVDRSLDESRVLIDRYRQSTSDASALAAGTRDDLDRDVWLSRVLIVVLGLAIAVGQIAPYRIGRELARTPSPTGSLTATGPLLAEVCMRTHREPGKDVACITSLGWG